MAFVIEKLRGDDEKFIVLGNWVDKEQADIYRILKKDITEIKGLIELE